MIKAVCIKMTVILVLLTNLSVSSAETPAANDAGKYGKAIPVSGNTEQLNHFFKALKEAKAKKIRIAHFGDSIILGDVLSENIRDNFQKTFGGNGAGFISMNIDDFGMRKTTTVSFSNDWKEGSIFKRNPDKMPLGINGSVFMPSDKSWSKYETSRYSKTLKSFSNVRLFYSNAANSSQIKYTFNNSQAKQVSLKGGSKVAELNLTNPNSTSFKIEFAGGQKPYFYGVSLENGNGVYLDNFPIKGNSGVSLVDIQQNVLKDFNSLCNYKLIIINFGVNVVSPEHVSYTWYEERMEKVINYFKEAFPETSILLVSVGDKSVKKGSKFISDPGIKALLQAQKNLVKKTNIAFWNLYEAMGGENAMLDWVDAKPALAYKDYCHLTPEGGEVVGELLTNALLDLYNKSK